MFHDEIWLYKLGITNRWLSNVNLDLFSPDFSLENERNEEIEFDLLAPTTTTTNQGGCSKGENFIEFLSNSHRQQTSTDGIGYIDCIDPTRS